MAPAREYEVPFQEPERSADLEVSGLAGVIALRKAGNERFLDPKDGVGLQIRVTLDEQVCRHILMAGSKFIGV
jgi:hypothetical protein